MRYCGAVPAFLVPAQIQEFAGSFTDSFVAVPLLQVVLDCCEAVGNLLRKVDEEKILKVETSGGCESILPWTPASAAQLGGISKHL